MPRGSAPEVVPRRRRVSLLAQIAVAVLSGAAAMYAIHSYQAPAGGAGRPGSAAAPPARPVEAKPLPPPLAAQKNLPPAQSSMLVVKEPGGAPDGMVRAYGDDPERSPRDQGPVHKIPEQKAPELKLNPRPFFSGFGSDKVGTDGIGHGFYRIVFRNLAPPPKAEPPPAQPPPQPEPAAPPVKRMPRMIEKTPIDPKDLVTASGLRPEDAPEPVFWTEDRVLRVAGAALVALIGACYILFSSGAAGVLGGKSRRKEESA